MLRRNLQTRNIQAEETPFGFMCVYGLFSVLSFLAVQPIRFDAYVTGTFRRSSCWYTSKTWNNSAVVDRVGFAYDLFNGTVWK